MACDFMFSNNTNLPWNMSDIFEQEEYGFAPNMMGPMNPKNFCDIIHEVNEILYNILIHVMHFPVAILIIITVFGKENEDAKWFVFHTTVLNMILGIVLEVTLFFPGCEGDMVVNMLKMYSIGLATNSIFPMAFTRFFYLYFDRWYEKVFTKKTLLPWILVYDAVNIAIYTYAWTYGTMIVCLWINVFMLISTLTCSFLVFHNIRKMMCMVRGSKNQNTISDLRKASFVCMFQASSIGFYLIATLYVKFYKTFISDFINEPPPKNREKYTGGITPPGKPPMMMEPPNRVAFLAYIFLDDWHNTMYLFFMILDTIFTMFVLRTYRNALKKVGVQVWERVQEVLYGDKKRRVSAMYYKRPSINTWTSSS